MTYLKALYHGNAGAFYFIGAMVCLGVVAFIHTMPRLTDKDFDAQMADLEREAERQRLNEIDQLYKMMR